MKVAVLHRSRASHEMTIMANRAELAAYQIGSAQAPIESSGANPTLDELMTCHPEYNPDLIEEYQTWYDGGSKFHEALESDKAGRYLVLRRADKEKLDGNFTYRKLRISRAQYSSEIGRIIASMQATILRNPPTLVDSDPYIRGLNADADGAGSDLKELARQILECGLLHKRAYVGPTFPGNSVPGMDLAQALNAGVLDGKLRFYHARDITWWSYATNGRLQSIRIYTYNDEFSRGTWGTLTKRIHRWSVVDDTTVTTYEYEQPAVKGKLQPIDKTKTAVIVANVPHGYELCPIKEYQFGKAFWVADRLVPPQKRLFNSEADEAFIRSECAHPQRVIVGTPIATAQDENGNQVVKASVVHALQFAEALGDYKLVGPDAAQAAWHGSAIERDRQNLNAALEALYLGLAAQSQNARQAASAKAMDASHSTLFMAFAAAQLEALILSVVKDIKYKRGSSTPLTMDGLNKIDGRTVDQAINEAKSFFELSPPPTARKFVLSSLSTRMMAGADDTFIEKASSELNAADDVSTVDINGAVAQGLISLVAAGLMSEEEARSKIGLAGSAPKPFSAPVSAAPNPGMPEPDAGDSEPGETDQE